MAYALAVHRFDGALACGSTVAQARTAPLDAEPAPKARVERVQPIVGCPLDLPMIFSRATSRQRLRIAAWNAERQQNANKGSRATRGGNSQASPP